MASFRPVRPAVALAGLAALLLAVASASAGHAALPPKFAGGQVKIALVRQLGSGDFFQQWLQGAQAQAKALHVKLLVSDAQNKNDVQATNLQEAINQKVDAIIVDHGLASTVDPLIDKAVKAGIPVIAFDVDTTNPKVVSISQDDVNTGRVIAQTLATALHGKGQIGYVYVAGYAPLDRRNAGWKQVKAKYPNLKQVAQFGTVSDSTSSDVEQQAQAVIAAHPDIDAFLAPYDEFAKGVTLALKQAGKTNVPVFGVDISTADINVITQAGSPWVDTIATDPANVGRVAVRAAALKVNGNAVPRNVLVKPTLISQAFLRKNDIKNMAQLRAKLPGLNTKSLLSAAWIPSVS